jgi:hypothetical protein
MSTIRRFAASGAGTLAIGVLLIVGFPAAAQAASEHSVNQAAAASPVARSAQVVAQPADLPCGYDGHVNGVSEPPLYNHCGTGDVEIEVDHFFWQTTYACVQPGVQELTLGSGELSIIGAEYDGKTCVWPG